MSAYPLALATALLALGLVPPGATAHRADYRDQDIFTVKVDASGRRNLTRNYLMEDRPTLSRDGRALVFEREDGSLEVMSPNGKGRRVLLRVPGMYAQRPVWSRDGALLAFTTGGYDDPSVGVVGRNGNGLVLIPNASDPTWLAGHRLAFRADFGPGFREGPHTLAVAKADGSDRRIVARAKDLAAYHLLPPVASPDGTSIAFSAYTGGWNLYSLDLTAGSTPRPLGVSGYDQVWSPDGRRLAFNNRGTLWIVRADGTRLRRLPGIRLPNSRLPSWSPDGQQVAFVRRAGKRINLLVTNLRARTFKVVARGVTPRRPVWSRNARRLFFVAERGA